MGWFADRAAKPYKEILEDSQGEDPAYVKQMLTDARVSQSFFCELGRIFYDFAANIGYIAFLGSSAATGDIEGAKDAVHMAAGHDAYAVFERVYTAASGKHPVMDWLNNKLGKTNTVGEEIEQTVMAQETGMAGALIGGTISEFLQEYDTTLFGRDILPGQANISGLGTTFLGTGFSIAGHQPFNSYDDTGMAAYRKALADIGEPEPWKAKSQKVLK